MSKNNLYDPTGAANCTLELLLAVGDTVNPCSVESGEIVELYIDEPHASTVDEPKNPMPATYTAWGTNTADLNTWKATVDNTTASKLRFFNGTGEKPEPEVNEVTLAGGVKTTIGVPVHVLTFTIDRMDNTTYQALRKFQKFQSSYHFWYSTADYIYGGKYGMKGEIVKVLFSYAGGGSEPSKATITINFKAWCEPVRDAKPW